MICEINVQVKDSPHILFTFLKLTFLDVVKKFILKILFDYNFFEYSELKFPDILEISSKAMY